MKVRIGVLSDTHIPVAAREIPRKVLELLGGVDLIAHAGDILQLTVLEELQELAEVRAVYGNMDTHSVREKLPEIDAFEVQGFKIGIIHGSGPPPSGIESRIREKFDEVDVIIYGHSHSPKNEIINDVLFFNPGSPTCRVFAPCNSFGILTIDKEIRGKIIKI
ncbi:metallophosphoesterase [candidate division NPL-UPA2 bacterium Unc8]|uniref:Phosphoesterase n=1 Tax=candidate division NPL-UPA2 bacterium Unc8 TaxID=1980939 RepID=A0A399FYF3_UNCN2|nr:putative metallophosphoesterase [Bacillota bacterium]MBT9137747.1 putative metallophosphoesterase [Bacillota bacterium]MBT9146315.1 putative metallophosphoesterase [Bacillota bacterium]RII00262.1 MAG: metallophosphoesterase [candidate division NPL-UPA2 bacterium Unc8]